MQDRGRRAVGGVTLVGALLTLGIAWSAQLGDWPIAATLLVLAAVWAVARSFLVLALGGPATAVPLDLAKMALQGGLRSEHHDQGAVVVRQGEPATHFYIVTRGRAVVHVQDEEFGRTDVGEILSGQFFGEVGLLTGAPRSATVEAAEPLDVLVMDETAFRGLVANADVGAQIRDVAAGRSAS